MKSDLSIAHAILIEAPRYQTVTRIRVHAGQLFYCFRIDVRYRNDWTRAKAKTPPIMMIHGWLFGILTCFVGGKCSIRILVTSCPTPPYGFAAGLEFLEAIKAPQPRLFRQGWGVLTSSKHSPSVDNPYNTPVIKWR